MLQMELRAPHVRVPDLWDDGHALYHAVIENELEGVVAKKLDAPYRAGRSNTWLKIQTS